MALCEIFCLTFQPQFFHRIDFCSKYSVLFSCLSFENTQYSINKIVTHFNCFLFYSFSWQIIRNWIEHFDYRLVETLASKWKYVVYWQLNKEFRDRKPNELPTTQDFNNISNFQCILIDKSLVNEIIRKKYQWLTFSSHSHLEALSQSTILTLISVMLINWTIAIPSTWVC